MLNDNPKIDYRNGFSFSFSCLYYRFSKLVGYARVCRGKHRAVACLASLLIKLTKFTLYGRPSCVACGGPAADWPA